MPSLNIKKSPELKKNILKVLTQKTSQNDLFKYAVCYVETCIVHICFKNNLRP